MNGDDQLFVFVKTLLVGFDFEDIICGEGGEVGEQEDTKERNGSDPCGVYLLKSVHQLPILQGKQRCTG